MRRSRALVLMVGLACNRAPAPTPGSTATPRATAAATHGRPCGSLGCTQYDDPRDAFLDAIASQPLVLGVGEAHAPKGAYVRSAARRFTDDLLPLLAPHASDLLVELMLPAKGCAAAVEVRRVQAPVVSRQAETNQSEYEVMGERARTLGVVPDALRPTCADMTAIGVAQSDGISLELETIARLTVIQGKRLVDRDGASERDRGKMVVIYGGALHNDLTPARNGPTQAERWSYAPALDAAVAGRFIALDLIVPEFIGDDAAWQQLPWRSFYDANRLGSATTLFRIDPKTFVLIFAKTPLVGADEASAGHAAPSSTR